MAVSPGTTNIAIKREIAERLRDVAKEAGVTALEVANQLLATALEQASIELQVKTITVNLDKLKPSSKRS